MWYSKVNIFLWEIIFFCPIKHSMGTQRKWIFKEFLRQLLFWVAFTLCAKRAFNKYVDQILPNFDPHPLRVHKNGRLTYYPFVTWTPVDFLLTHPLPRSCWMPPNQAFAIKAELIFEDVFKLAPSSKQ